jgi:hypothetical protein
VNTIISFVSVCFLVLLVGCNREAKAPPQPPPASELPASPRGLARTGEAPAPAIPDSGDTNAILQQMTLALRDYVVRTRSVPKNFDEFAAKSQGSFPQPPAGQKYAIEGQKVVLVKR